MFFGLTNSPATFQTVVNTIFQPHIRGGWFSIYMDDGVIHTKRLPHETEDEHLARHHKHVHEIFELLEKHDLYLKPEKCAFKQDEIEFLGVRVGRGKLQMDLGKISVIKTWPIPRNVKDIRSFLGFTGYYRYFIPQYSTLARPLLILTRKAAVWKWGPEQEAAFRMLQAKMCAAPVLRQPDFEKKFFLQTDASTYGMGAVLSQEYPGEGEKP
jgi:hypothetical protein